MQPVGFAFCLLVLDRGHIAQSRKLCEPLHIILRALEQFRRRQRQGPPLRRCFQINASLFQLPPRRFVRYGGEQLAFFHALPDGTPPGREGLGQPNESGILRAHMHHERGFDAHRSVDR